MSLTTIGQNNKFYQKKRPYPKDGALLIALLAGI
jgi:hypothetical protein